ncbi:hypothetical protein AAV99_11155 [Aurantiacibacter marinus]|uniref:Uncharacterized protein n=1 Tax=Aurantiacibacter marinus TaxID=874156 RepID=A0A0H0XMI0_9SPHN|nr:hypothetical protein AAV99_11155 [Aurantiacibacter marinus]
MLILAACGSDPVADQPGTPAGVQSSTNLSNGALGTVRYKYDPAALTRAEVDLVLPPDFEQTVFAIKFIPAPLASRLGGAYCSFGRVAQGQECTARSEIGFAIALLERPIADYTTALAQASPSIATLEPVMVDGQEGMSFVLDSEFAHTRYTYLPSGGRTLLLVDRYTDGGIDAGTEALDQVRRSIDL